MPRSRVGLEHAKSTYSALLRLDLLWNPLERRSGISFAFAPSSSFPTLYISISLGVVGRRIIPQKISVSINFLLIDHFISHTK